MKSVKLVQIFCPVKETNWTHSKGYVEDLSTQAGRKQMHQDCSAEFISASSNFPNVKDVRGESLWTSFTFAGETIFHMR